MVHMDARKALLVKLLAGVTATCAAVALQSALALPAMADVQAQAELVCGQTATVTTDSNGEAYVRVLVEQEGVYSMSSVASSEVDGDTIGYLYNESMELLSVSDDVNADTNFCISEQLDAGTYYLCVAGKEGQENAAVSVDMQAGQSLSSLSCIASYSDETGSYALQLGQWVHAKEKTEWQAAADEDYAVVGYIEKGIFAHALEVDAAGQLIWNEGLPQDAGRFALKVSAVANGAYIGDAYYLLEGNVDSQSISELAPRVTYALCGAVDAVELGINTTTPTNWSTRWDAITASFYTVVGYCEQTKFMKLGGKDTASAWTKGLPHDVGKFAVKLEATDADENPYTGTCYVWTEINEVEHVGSGSWIVSKRPTFTAAGSRHLTCSYCGAAASVTSIPALKNTATTAGSGTTLADYKFLSAATVSYVKCYSQKTSAKVPNTVKIDGVTYKVVAVAAKAFAANKKLTSVTIGTNVAKIGKNAFKGCKKLKKLTVNTKKLKKAGIKNCLKGSSVTTVKVPKAKKKAYAKIFTKSICGKKVTVK